MKRASWFIAFASGMFALAASAQPALQTLITNGLAEPYGVAVDVDNSYYITDSANNRVAKYSSNSGALTNLAGVFGESGADDGPGVFARFFNPQGIVAARGGMVVADSGNNLIRRIAFDGSVTTLAGSTTPGFTDAAGTSARFNFPTGLAVDAAGDIYVADLLNNRIRKIDANNAVTTVASGLSRPAAVAVDKNSGLVYVADTGTHSIRLIQPNGTVSLFAGSGSAFVSGSRDSLVATNALFNGPRALLWVGGNTGLLVSDTGNHMLRRIYFNAALNTYSVERYVTSTTIALDAPLGLAIDNNGNVPLVDLGSDRLYSIQVTAPQAPVADPTIGIVILTTNNFGQLRTSLIPVVNSTFNNDVNVAILAERGTDTFFTPDPNANFPQDPASRNTPAPYENGLLDWSRTLVTPSVDGSNITLRAISTQDGRRPSSVVTARFQFKVAGSVINGKNPSGFSMDNATEAAAMWYTADGSTPTNSTPSILYVRGARLNIVDGTNNVVFKVRAFKTGYAPSAVTEKVFLFSDLQTSSIGVTRDFVAGIGSTIVVPVEVKLAPGDVLRSLQFRIELTPNGGAPSISTQFRSLSITTNDFLRIPLPSTNPPIATSYTSAGKTGLAISFVGASTGMNVNDSATVAMLAVPIPTSASIGQTYKISVVQPSGTADGLQTPIPLTTFKDRTITVTNVTYVVGDSAVANWYNAGDFGNGNLNNNDINNVFHASLGLLTPYSFTDVFDAMDTFPEDSASSVGGDGQVRFLDWQIALQRSLRLTPTNWKRSWSAGGVRTGSSATLNNAANSPAAVLTSAKIPRLWLRQALVQVLPVENAAPGSQISASVYLKVAKGYKVAGLQLRAAVVPEGNAPLLNQPVSFNANLRLPRPITLQGAQDGLPLNQAVSAWSLVQNPFSSPLEGDTFLGEIQFAVPATAKSGQAYTVRIINADGAPDLQTQYDFESLHGSIWVGTPAQTPAETISDEWRAHFFGNWDHILSQAEADPDGDGLTNREEFFAGTNPIDLRFHGFSSNWRSELNSTGVKLRWFGEAGKQYRAERSSDFKNWTSVGVDLTGKGDVLELTAPKAASAQFYRLNVQGSSSGQ